MLKTPLLVGGEISVLLTFIVIVAVAPVWLPTIVNWVIFWLGVENIWGSIFALKPLTFWLLVISSSLKVRGINGAVGLGAAVSTESLAAAVSCTIKVYPSSASVELRVPGAIISPFPVPPWVNRKAPIAISRSGSL